MPSSLKTSEEYSEHKAVLAWSMLSENVYQEEQFRYTELNLVLIAI